MLCEQCGKREATVNVVCVVNDKKINKWLCSQCAKEFASKGLLQDRSGGGLSEGTRNLLEEIFAPLRGLALDGGGDREEREAREYTEEARRILRAARRCAAQRKHEEVGTEHILWGILQEKDCFAAYLLVRCGVDKYTLLGELESWMGMAKEGALAENYSGQAQGAMKYARAFADVDDLYLVSSAHLLMGLLAQENCVASRVLSRFKVAMKQVSMLMKEEFIQTRELPEGNKLKSEVQEEKRRENLKRTLDMLKDFGRNLNDLAEKNKLDPVIGREEELNHLMRILCRRTKNNPVIIGEAGVGKTAVAEGLARKIVAKEVPEFLQDKIIFSLELGYVIAGAKYRGELEERLRDIIEAVKASPQIILFMDEMQMLMNGTDGNMSIANIIKPALSRGELHVIGATTTDEYRKTIEKDAALERRFQPVMVKAPSTEETLEILKRLCGRYEKFHKVHITEEALGAAVRLSDRYIPDRNLPDKAIDVIDEACAGIRLQSVKDYTGQMGDPMVTGDTVRKVISLWTDIPLTRLTAAESRSLLQLEETLHQRVVGQNDAIRGIARAVRRARAGMKDPHRPVGSFLFLGPTGVGKTELAKALAETLFGDERALIRLDMSEFMEKHTASRLIGAPPGYIGYEEGGKLTTMVKRRPYSVILLDEIEKAHPDIFNLLLQIMEDGRLTDGQGVTVDFRNTLLIMTSNACADLMANRTTMGFTASADQEAKATKEKVLDGIKKIFRPEFLNRVDETVVFDQLGKKELAAILDRMLADLQKRQAETGLKLKATPAAWDKLLEEGTDVRYGARPLRRAMQRHIEDRLADLYLEGTFSKGDHVLIDVFNGDFSFTKIVSAQQDSLVPVEKETTHG